MPRQIQYTEQNLVRIAEEGRPLIVVEQNRETPTGVIALPFSIENQAYGQDALIHLTALHSDRETAIYARRVKEIIPLDFSITVANLTTEQYDELRLLAPADHPLLSQQQPIVLISPESLVGYIGPAIHQRRGFDLLDARIETHFKVAKFIIANNWSSGFTDIKEILPADVIDLINHSPGMPQLPGIIRNITNKLVPNEVMRSGGAEIIQWLLKNVKSIPLPPQNVTAPNRGARPIQAVNIGELQLTRTVRFEFTQSEQGSCNYSCSRIYRGEYEVPIDVLRQGENATHRWIMDAAYEDGDYETVDYDYEDYESNDTGDLELQESNYQEVVDALDEVVPTPTTTAATATTTATTTQF